MGDLLDLYRYSINLVEQDRAAFYERTLEMTEIRDMLLSYGLGTGMYKYYTKEQQRLSDELNEQWARIQERSKHLEKMFSHRINELGNDHLPDG